MLHAIPHARRLAAWRLVALAALLPACSASSPKFFQAATQDDFLKGDVENLSIDSHGQLTLGPATELVYETSAPFLWSMVAAPDGTLFIGTGNEGKVFRVDPQGKGIAVLRQHGARGARARASRPTAASTSARRRTAASTRSIATGPPHLLQLGRQIHLGAGGRREGQPVRRHGRQRRHLQDRARRQGRAVLQDQRHARDGARLRQGRQPAGRHRDARAKCCGSTPDGKAFVLLDSPFQEIRALRFDDKGTLYVAALSGRGPSGSVGASDNIDRPTPEPSRADSVGLGRDHVDVDRRRRRRDRVDGHAARGSPVAEGRGLSHLAGRRLGPAVGVARRLAVRSHLRSERRADHRHRQQGQAVSPRGRPAAADAARPRQRQQVTAFYKDARGRLYYATANPGKLFRLSPERAPREAPTSPRRATRRWSPRGGRSAGAPPRPRAAASRCSRGRATRKRRTTPGAPGRPPTPTPTARRSRVPRRATCNGARC